jgi:23S rRNA (pseudouridine1915-N3)-methyltransferase
MRVTIAAAGKLKAGTQAELIAKYQKQLPWKLTIKEIPAGGAHLSSAQRIEQESAALLKAVEDCRRLIACDSGGKHFSSEDLAAQLQHWQEAGDQSVAFLIGGADGLSEEVLRKADATLAFGRATWPHMLARVMLCEQVYRAWSITSGHPYHSGH